MKQLKDKPLIKETNDYFYDKYWIRAKNNINLNKKSKNSMTNSNEEHNSLHMNERR